MTTQPQDAALQRVAGEGEVNCELLRPARTAGRRGRLGVRAAVAHRRAGPIQGTNMSSREMMTDDSQAGTGVRRVKLLTTAVAPLFVAGLFTATAFNASPASAAVAPLCQASGWYTGTTRVATGSYSPSFDNDAQLIRFVSGTGWVIYKKNADCTTSKAVMANAAEYKVRNQYPFAWTSWKSFTYGQANACGTHPIAPGYWGCAFGTGKWARWY